ncbi:MAG: putative acyl-CoA dehydrogenase [Acidimicrobiaceae bacterium]|nr:putative acyl-CoA dehydrogenase [Acidimicrobiaceae bacterium]
MSWCRFGRNVDAVATHEVLNQPPPLVDYDVFAADAALSEALSREGAAWATGELRSLGTLAGSAEPIEWGFQANANPPVLKTHDRYGNRIDAVDYHPAYHSLMQVAVGEGMHAAPWADARLGAHVARAAKFYVWSQVEPGHGCPISMTYAVVPALRANADAAAQWEPLLFSRDYDGRNLPASQKRGAIAGMAMTEKQGGSDVRANTTQAVATDGHWELTGHKWFCSAPMSDVFLMLAQTPAGLSCFAVPRWRPDGTKNPVQLQRLKDKLGNRSNASSEIELDRAYGVLVGEEGRGVRTIIAMVNHTRLDCVIGASATMRQALAQAAHHAAHRSAFGKALLDQPLMGNVLADLAVESEAATTTMMRLARAYDAADEGEAAFRRLATAVAKYWTCKRQPAFVAEALECLGGNGFVEESIMPRLFRESPLNGIWEGSGNVICLDVLRAMAREPQSLDAFRAEVLLASGADARFDAFVSRLDAELTDIDAIETRARRVVEHMALALQGSLLLRHSPAPMVDAFCASRLERDWGVAFGTLPARAPVDAVVERARPKS